MRITLPALALALSAVLTPAARGQFTGGNLVVSHLQTNTSAAATVVLTEFTPTGTATGYTITLPNTSPGQNQPAGTQLALTESGSAVGGYFSLTTNGMALSVGGYNASTGTAAVASSATNTVNRTIGLIAPSGAVNTTNGFNTGGANGFRSVAAVDGTAFYFSTATNVNYQPATGSAQTTPTTLFSGTLRNTGIFGNSLFVSGAGTGTLGISLVGTAGTLPTATGQTLTVLDGTQTNGTGTVSPYGFVLLDNPLNTNSFMGTGLDTLYVADDRSAANGGGILRFVFDGTNWGTPTVVNNGVGYRALTASLDPDTNTVRLFAITTQTSANRLESVTDALTVSGGSFGTVSVLSTAAASTVYRGVAFTPTPEPVGILLSAGLMVVGVRRWRRATKSSA